MDGVQVSAVLPAHNAAGTVRRALRSIQAQTTPVHEIIVVDDHSTDGTWHELGACAAEDRRIRILEANARGAGHARNRGVAEATGDVIAFLDADDVWYPDKLETQLPFLAPDIAFVGALVHYLGEDGSMLGSYLPFEDCDLATESLRRGETMPVSLAFSVMLREVFEAAGGFDESFFRTQDLELAQRLVADGKRLVWPPRRALAGYVLNSASVTASSYREQFLAAELVRARVRGEATPSYDEWQQAPDISRAAHRALRSGQHYRLAAVAKGKGAPLQVARHGILAIATDPLGVSRKLVRRNRHVGVLMPATPPAEVRSLFANEVTPSSAPATSRSHLPLADLPTVNVAGLWLVQDPRRLAYAAVQEYLARPRTVTLLAAHVTALNSASCTAFRRAFNAADGGYIDGVSLSIVAHVGGERAEKLATTDLAPLLIRDLSSNLGRPVRVAVLGGEPSAQDAHSSASLAAQAIATELPVEIVYVNHGYQMDWPTCLARLGDSAPEVLLVGLGMPLEATWTEEHASRLPAAIVITCGGWLRLLAGEEARASEPWQRAGLEWLYRLVNDPHRTGRRYALGVVNVLRHCAVAAITRWQQRPRGLIK